MNAANGRRLGTAHYFVYRMVDCQLCLALLEKMKAFFGIRTVGSAHPTTFVEGVQWTRPCMPNSHWEKSRADCYCIAASGFCGVRFVICFLARSLRSLGGAGLAGGHYLRLFDLPANSACPARINLLGLPVLVQDQSYAPDRMTRYSYGRYVRLRAYGHRHRR